eukprot:403332270
MVEAALQTGEVEIIIGEVASHFSGEANITTIEGVIGEATETGVTEAGEAVVMETMEIGKEKMTHNKLSLVVIEMSKKMIMNTAMKGCLAIMKRLKMTRMIRKTFGDDHEIKNEENQNQQYYNGNQAKRFQYNSDYSMKNDQEQEDNSSNLNFEEMANEDNELSCQEVQMMDQQPNQQQKPQRRVQFQGISNDGDDQSHGSAGSRGQQLIEPKYPKFGDNAPNSVTQNTYTKKDHVYCHGFGYAKMAENQIKLETGLSSPSKFDQNLRPPQDRLQSQLPFNPTISLNGGSSQNQNNNNGQQTTQFGQIKQESGQQQRQLQPQRQQQTTIPNMNNRNGKFNNKNAQPPAPLTEQQRIGKELFEIHLESMRMRKQLMEEIKKTTEFKNLPWFLLPEKILDGNKRRPDDPKYDPSTIFIPQHEMQKFSPFLQQYWEIKRTHFDKVLCFQKGKFYELYYIDALIGHYFLKIQWSGGANPINYLQAIQVGIHEKNLNKSCQELIDIGFKVAVIEQVEDKHEVDKRMKINNNNNFMKNRMMMQKTHEQLVKRDLSGIYTRGIAPYDPSSVDYETKWILALFVSTRSTPASFGQDPHIRIDKISVAFFDNTTLQIHMGQFDEDQLYSKMRTLLCQIRPVEVIYDKESISLDVVKMLKEQPLAPDLNSISLRLNNVDFHKGIQIALNLYGPDVNQWPKVLQQFRQSQHEYEPTWIAFAMMVMYLQNRLVADQILKLTDIHLYDPINQLKTHMEIDAQAVRHLELLEVIGTEKPKVEGSLFHYLDYTKTVFGKRLLKKWISSPLYDIDKINSRLDSIEDFNRHPDLIFKLQEKLKMLPDLEKECTNIYKLSTRANISLLTFEKLDIESLRDFFNLLEKIKFVNQILGIFKTAKEGFKSKRLKALLTMKDPTKKQPLKNEDIKPKREQLDSQTSNQSQTTALFPEINNAIAEFEALIMWSNGSNGEKIPEPIEEFDADYDIAKKRIQEIEKKLDNHLQEVRDMFGYKSSKEIKFAHSTHQRYMLEIPKVLVEGGKRPPDFELVKTSTAQVNLKFITSKIRTYVSELEDAEYNIKIAIMPFICSIFEIFRQKRRIWSQIVSCLAEIDCLASMAIVSQSSDGLTCRPIFIKPEDNFSKPYLELRKMKHPCVNLTFNPVNEQQQTIGFSDEPVFKTSHFIPNDTIIGRLDQSQQHITSNYEDNQPNILLLTGPNMGGKSTLLRQTCLAVIIAQIGCYVPAEKCILTPVDKIFTRLGASDKLLEKKSTFYVEMEETKAILDKATQNSLAVLDELGRGTSTYDGLSIADAVLQYLADKIGCRSLFATHYHQLCSKYEDHPLIQNASMTYNLDIKNQKITYLFQLKKEKCGKSFGINVAQIAGLPQKIIKTAMTKSIELEKSLEEVYKRYLESRNNIELRKIKQQRVKEQNNSFNFGFQNFW